MVPHRPAAKAATSTTERTMSSPPVRAGERRLALLRVHPASAVRPEIIAAHDPLSAAALLPHRRGCAIAGAERDGEHADADHSAEGAREGPSGDEEDVR